jgi:hypothetical protein
LLRRDLQYLRANADLHVLHEILLLRGLGGVQRQHGLPERLGLPEWL